MYTRSRLAHDHLLQTPDTFVRTPLPGLTGGVAIQHAGPALGARFWMYSIEFGNDGGVLAESEAARFVYVLEGQITKRTQPHAAGGFVFTNAAITAAAAARVVVIDKPYIPLPGVQKPGECEGFVSQIPGAPLGSDPDLLVQPLLPDDVAFDFAVNLMTYQPGASLPQVESHVMEHGLLMLEGWGVYRLGDAWYTVAAKDFIWMAPFCPQWFGALGKTPAKYLIYKDWNRL